MFSLLDSSRLQKFHCQLYQTYLPSSYHPQECQNTSTLDYPQWTMSLINTFFISTATFVNTSIFLVIVFLWMVNRQFHFKQHSYEKPPLQPLKRARTSLRHARRSIKSRMMLKKRGGGGGDDDDDNSTILDAIAEIEYDEQKILLDKEKLLQRNYKSFQSFLADVNFQEDDEDDDEGDDDSRHDNDVIMEEVDDRGESNYDDIAAALSMDETPPSETNTAAAGVAETIEKQPTPWRNVFALNPTKDLLHLASKIEVFSYLSPAAVRHVLKYVEYLDFANIGDVVFNRDTLDGSMYCVVTGEVATTLMIEGRGDFSFASPPGEVITSLLTIITSLIQEYQHQDGSLPACPESGKVVLPDGMDCNCIVSKPNTRLLKIPARCFVAILEKFPQDVHRICQTIVARLQRVTIQTLVRFLGLGQEVLGLSQRQDDNGDASSLSDSTPLKTPRKTDVFTRFEESLKSGVSCTEESLLNQASIAVASLLGLSAEETGVLREGVSITTSPPMSTIIRSGEPPQAVYVILKGSLEVGLEENDAQANNVTVDTGEGWKAKARRTKNVSSTPRTEDGQGGQTTAFKPLFRSSPGAFLGMFSCFTHEANLVTIRNATEHDAIILKIPTKTFDLIASKHPRALIHCLSGIIDTLGGGNSLCVSPAMFLLDWTLDWMHVESGEYIAIEGEECDSMFVVLNGRLRAGERATNGNPNVEMLPKSSDTSRQEEFGRGATIGELEALVEGRWRSSVFASRHCEVARIPIGLVSVLMEMFPSAGIRFAKSIAAQVCSRKGITSMLVPSSPSILPSYALSLATIAVVPLSSNVDVGEFCQTLTSSLECIAPTKLLTKKETKERVGEEFFRHPNAMLKVKMTRILGDLEENHRLVVYEAQAKYSWWTKLCIQQADCILLLADSQHVHDEAGRLEECISWAHEAKSVRVELVVIQSPSAVDTTEASSQTSDRLNKNWSVISKYHLVRCPFDEHTKDFQRMSRRVSGKSIGLCLGGGGARGLAHLGVIKALNEVGVSIDHVGGTSQGAFVGALLAKYPDDEDKLIEAARIMAQDMSSIKEKLLDLTLPITSYFSGYRFNLGIKKVLGETKIQDFPLSFFCVSSDVANSEMVIHTTGTAWKFVRASMSLAGYLPPIADGNRLLADGGYMNIVPADVMADTLGAKTVIAVDVSAMKNDNFYQYGTELSGLWLLWNSWNPFVQTVKVPSMSDLTSRLSWISSTSSKRQVESKADLFLTPPVADVGTLEYDRFDEVVQLGYDYAKPIIEKWATENGHV